MSIRLLVTRGFGNGTFSGTIKDVVLRGYGIGEVVVTPERSLGVEGLIDSGGQGVTGRILASGLSVFGEITVSLAVEGLIDTSGQGVIGRISSAGQSVEGDL
jgi:hypothetical protein